MHVELRGPVEAWQRYAPEDIRMLLDAEWAPFFLIYTDFLGRPLEDYA